MKSKRSRVPYRINPRRNMPRHILIKLTKIKNKERILKAAREKQQVRRPPIKVGGPHSYGWKGICLTKSYFLYNLSFLVSLNPPTNRKVEVGATEGLWRGYSSVCPEAPLPPAL